MLNICECFKSIQGESTWAGMPCGFIRLSTCNLRCSYCDTSYSWDIGNTMNIEEIIEIVDQWGVSVVEITGGEPLLQEETPLLCQRFLDKHYTVLVETNGTLDISVLPSACIKIVDIKCPSSGVTHSFYLENIKKMKKHDEYKMVISTLHDFEWALQFVFTHALYKHATVLFSPNMNCLSAEQLAEWILHENAPVRLNIQLHKVIWPHLERGR